jgi:hypothetical protein
MTRKFSLWAVLLSLLALFNEESAIAQTSNFIIAPEYSQG